MEDVEELEDMVAE
ncbi:hypothetical protein Tco_0677267, partial [Tanacetum coccineum]